MASVRAVPRLPRRPTWLTLPVALGFTVLAFWLAAALSADLWGLTDPLKMIARRLRSP